MSTYYKPSGKFTILSLVYFILILVTALPLLALLYSYCIWYIPFVYINFFITLAFGIITGFIISKVVVKIGKVRNPTVAFFLGLIAGCVALYFNWAVWVDLVINSGENYGTSRIGITVSNIKFLEVFSLAAQPNILFDYISLIGEQGTWGIKGNVVNGTFLYIIWGIEMLIVIAAAIIFPSIEARLPFCEVSNRWFDEQELPAFSLITDPQKMVSALETSNPEAFLELERVKNPEQQSHSIITLYTSKQGENYISIENKTAKENKKGEIEFDGDEFVEYIAIGSVLRTQLVEK